MRETLMRPLLQLAAALVMTVLAPLPALAAGEGQVCGGIVGLACDAGLWCETRAGFCHGADIQGTCVRVPEVCTRIYQPVCGCDGKTYGNDCDRRAMKVAKDHDGACN